MDHIDIGFIGLGKHGKRYLNHILNEDVSGINVGAVSKRTPFHDHLGHGIRTHVDDNDSIFDDGSIDAIIVLTPTGTHSDLAIEAMENGKHVLVEKPMASTASDCRDMIDTANKNNVKLMVSQTLRYNPTVLRMKEIWKDLDDAKKISMEQHLEPPDRDWLYDPDLAGGGVLLNTGVHVFDTIRFITGSSINMKDSFISHIRNKKLDDLAFGHFKLDNQIKGSFSLARYHDARRREITVHTDKRKIFADAMREYILDNMEYSKAKGEKRTIIPLLEDFRNCILNDSDAPISGYEGMEAVKVCEMAYGISKKV
ncbi:MAG: Gfo/Idh/MocA family oxidoreductase [Thermoplasmatota archaeon]